MVMHMTLLEPHMIDDFDGALEMDDDGPLMEIAYGDGPHTWWSLAWMLMILCCPLMYDDWSPDDDDAWCMDGDGSDDASLLSLDDLMM